MNLKLVLVLIALSLTACAGHTARDDSPDSDLVALETSVARDLRPRLLPSGKEYCAELATTEAQQDDCMGDLEDGLFASNRDKERAKSTLHKAIERLKLARNPCGFFEFGCRKRARALDSTKGD